MWRKCSQLMAETIARERQQLALWIPVGMGAGIAFYFELQREPAPFWGLIGFAMGIVLLVVRLPQWARLIASALVASFVGFASAQFSTWVNPTKPIMKPTSFLDLTGTLENVSETQYGLRLVVSEIRSAGEVSLKIPPKIRLSARLGSEASPNPPSPGNRIRLTAALRPPPPPHFPGSYDFQRRAFFHGIGAYGFVIGEIDVLNGPEPSFKAYITHTVHKLRADIAARARNAGPGPPGAVAAAMLTGHRGTIPETTLKHMRDAGIAHLLAISGLHIGLAAGTVFIFLRLLIAAVPGVGLRLNAKKIASVGAISVAGGYAVLAGLTVPTERAFLMSSLMLIGVLIDRRAVSMRSVAWAAGLILLIHPDSLLEPGFQMSFAAVICLVSAYEQFSSQGNARGNVLKQTYRYAAGVMLTSIVAGIATAPFAIFHFQHVAVFGLIANVIAVPLAAFWVMPAGLLALALYPIGLEYWPLVIMSEGIRVILLVAETVAALPGAASDIIPPPTNALLCIVLGGLWLCLWRSRLRILGIIPISLGVLMAISPNDSPNVIVDGRGRIVAVVGPAREFYVSTQLRAKYSLNTWIRRHGGGEVAPWNQEGQLSSETLRCDVNGCRLNVSGKTISISLNEAGLMEDCLTSDVIVALVPIRTSCHLPEKTIDWFDLWRYGTHAVYIEGKNITVQTVNQMRGKRPWVVQPPPAKGFRPTPISSSDTTPSRHPGP